MASAPPPGFRIIQGGTAPPPPPSYEEAAAAAPEKDYRQADAATIARGAVDNFIPSAGKFVGDTVEAVTHPAETVNNIGELGSGAFNLIPGVDSVLKFGQEAGLLHTPDAAELAKVERQKEMARGVGRHYADKYGSVSGFGHSVATDPVGVLADLSTVFTGGGTAVGRALNPANIAARATKPVRVVAREVLGGTTGAGGDAIKEAYDAGKKGGSASKRLSANMKGLEEQHAVVTQAKDAVQKIRDEGHNAYLKSMEKVKAFNTPIDANPIVDELMKLKNSTTQNGALKASPQELKMIDDIEKALIEQAHNPLGDTAFALDALKQRISKMETWENRHTPEGRIPAAMAATIKRTIVQSGVPGYKEAMGAWERTSHQIKEVERALSVGDKSSLDSALRKMQSVFRNNANTNYGSRVKQVDKLQNKYGAKDIKPALAGQALSGRMPRGLSSLLGSSLAGGGAVAAAAGLFEPATAAAVAAGALATSPRFVGRAAQIAGKGARFATPEAALALRDAGSISNAVEEASPEAQTEAAAAPQAQAPQGVTREQALAEAQAALDAGADPIKVKERLNQYLNSMLPAPGQ